MNINWLGTLLIGTIFLVAGIVTYNRISKSNDISLKTRGKLLERAVILIITGLILYAITLLKLFA